MTSENIEISVSFDVILVYLEFKKTAAEVAAELFLLLKEANVSLDSLNLMPLRRPASGLSFAVENGDFSKLLRTFAQLKDKSDPMQLTVSGGYAKICLAATSETMSGFFRALSLALPETICISATGTTLSALVPMAGLDRMLNELEKVFPNAETVYKLRDS